MPKNVCRSPEAAPVTVIPSMVTFGAARGIVGAFESSKAVINCAKGPSQDNGLNIVRGDIPIGVWLHALIYVAKICKACRVDVNGVKYWRIFGHDGINVASINATAGKERYRCFFCALWVAGGERGGAEANTSKRLGR